jgi:hypothetical protein
LPAQTGKIRLAVQAGEATHQTVRR